MPEYDIREAMAADIPAITTLVLEHGPNPCNYLPEQSIREHVEGIRTGAVEAVVADARGSIIGVVTFALNRKYSRYEPSDAKEQDHGYLAEAVVHRDYTGQGIGTALFHNATERLMARDGVRAVYSHRHEMNHGSRRMMENTGFDHVDTLDDRTRNEVEGSARTTVMRKVAP